MNLKDKKILVTGSSSGIGQAIAIALAQKGAFVFINHRKNSAGSEETLRKVKEYSNGEILQADLEDKEQISHLFERMGQIDGLVNNAGDAQPGGFFDNDQWKNQFENIFFSALHVSQAYLKQIGKDEPGKILNITSLYGNLGSGNPEYFSYSTAKAALSSMTATLATEYPNVQINAVAPGYTWTPPWEGIRDDEKAEVEAKTVINRFLQPDEIAEIAISVLANDGMTGQIITVDGGASLHINDRSIGRRRR
jgi:NAD(P)-dependent dehydrogenase (short-subunit alcohol dehydrogenase family)